MPVDEQPPLRLNREQAACLASPVKREIFEAMLAREEATVNELAVVTERSPKSLYYHIRQMCEVGLMRVKETRPAGTRVEAVYAPVASRIVVEDTGDDPGQKETALRSVRALLRRVEREFRAVAETPADSGYPLDTEVLRLIVRLEPAAKRRLEEMLREAARFARENSRPEGARYALTAFLTSLPRGE